jgi:hypothetical protein
MKNTMMALAALALVTGNVKAALDDTLELSDLRYVSLGYHRDAAVGPVIEYQKDPYPTTQWISETFSDGRVRFITYGAYAGLSFTKVTALLAENHLPPLDSDYWWQWRHFSNMVQWLSRDGKYSATIGVAGENPSTLDVDRFAGGPSK